MSPVWMNAHLSSSDRLCPCEVILPTQFPPARLFARRVFFTVSVPAAMPPPPAGAELSEKVLLVTVSVPKLVMPPLLVANS